MPGRLFITPRDSAPCISRPLSRPEGPASRSATPNASKTTTGLRVRLHGQTHDKRATHQTRYALETAATVSSPLRHRDRTKPQKKQQSRPFSDTETAQNPEKRQSRPIPSTETAQNPGKTAVSSPLRHRDRTKPQKNHSLVPSQAPRPRKTPEKMQSRPISSTETTQTPGKTTVSSHPKHRDTQTPRKTAVSSPLRHRDHTKSRKSYSLVPSQAPRPYTTEGREGWDSYYVLQGRGGKRGKDGAGRHRRDEAGKEGKTGRL